MVLGRVAHYAVDAVLISTILAGVKRTSGFGVSTPALGLPEGSSQSIVNRYLGLGESIFDWACAASYTSKYFVRGASSPPGTTGFPGKS